MQNKTEKQRQQELRLQRRLLCCNLSAQKHEMPLNKLKSIRQSQNRLVVVVLLVLFLALGGVLHELVF